MQLRYVFSETATGLRRNMSMSVALVVTIFISLTLVGMGLLLNSQADKAQQFWGSKLQITAFMCNQNSPGQHCAAGNATPQQKQAVQKVLDTNPEVASWYHQSKQQAFDIWKKVYLGNDKSNQEIYSTVTANDMQESYWIKLKDPKQFGQVKSALLSMDGVTTVRDLRGVLKPIYFMLTAMKWGALSVAVFLLGAAILQVVNTIRLAVLARRKEIGIMRLVGASRLYITIPFLIETFVAALVGVLLATGALSAFTYLVIDKRMRPNSNIVQWIDWNDTITAVAVIAALGLVLTALPTLVVTRKYLKV